MTDEVWTIQKILTRMLIALLFQVLSSPRQNFLDCTNFICHEVCTLNSLSEFLGTTALLPHNIQKIARDSDGVIYIKANKEIAVAATNSFLGQVVALTLLSMLLGQVRGLLTTWPRKLLVAATAISLFALM